MKIMLRLEQPASGCEAFAPEEYVRGYVNLYLRQQDTVSKIIISLQGSVLGFRYFMLT